MSSQEALIIDFAPSLAPEAFSGRQNYNPDNGAVFVDFFQKAHVLQEGKAWGRVSVYQSDAHAQEAKVVRDSIVDAFGVMSRSDVNDELEASEQQGTELLSETDREGLGLPEDYDLSQEVPVIRRSVPFSTLFGLMSLVETTLIPNEDNADAPTMRIISYRNGSGDETEAVAPWHELPPSVPYDPEVQKLDRGGRLPLSEARQKEIDDFKKSVVDNLNGVFPNTRATTHSKDAYADTEGDSDENYRDEFWHQLSEAMGFDLEAWLNSSEKQDAPVEISMENGAKLGLRMRKPLTLRGTHREVSLKGKSDIWVKLTEIEFPNPVRRRTGRLPARPKMMRIISAEPFTVQAPEATTEL